MDSTTTPTYAAYQGNTAHLYDIATTEKVGTIFIYRADADTFARFVEFNPALDKWFFAEMPLAFVDNPHQLADLILQLGTMNAALLYHPNDQLPAQAGASVAPRYIQ